MSLRSESRILVEVKVYFFVCGALHLSVPIFDFGCLYWVSLSRTVYHPSFACNRQKRILLFISPKTEDPLFWTLFPFKSFCFGPIAFGE